MEGDYQLSTMIVGGLVLAFIAFVVTAIVSMAFTATSAGVASVTRWRDRKRTERGEHLPRATTRPSRSRPPST